MLQRSTIAFRRIMGLKCVQTFKNYAGSYEKNRCYEALFLGTTRQLSTTYRNRKNWCFGGSHFEIFVRISIPQYNAAKYDVTWAERY